MASKHGTTDLPDAPVTKRYHTPQHLQDTVDHFEAHCVKGQTLFEEKNRKYNSAFEAYGLLGVIFELMGAVSRLPGLVMWSSSHGADSATELRDILVDIHNYANMALICIDRQNWDGR